MDDIVAVQKETESVGNNEQSQNSSSKQTPQEGSHYVVDGALFKCSMDSTGGTVISQMKSSNQSVFAQDKPLVTDQDKTFSAPFGTCLAKPTPSGSFAPCCCKAEWILDNTIDTKKNANLPTEKSKLTCSAGGGQITCIFHGQKKGVTAGDISNTKIETLSNIPFALVLTFPTIEDLENKKEASKVNSVKASKKCVRIGEELTLNIFSDNGKTKELKSPDFANFAITKTKEVKKETGKGKSARTVTETQIEKLTIYKHVYPPFKIKLGEAGKYCIEAGSDGMLNGNKARNVIGYNNLDPKKPLKNGNNIPMYKNCAEEVEVISNNSIVGIEKKGDYKEIDETETVDKKEVKKRIAYVKQGKELTLTPKFLLDFDEKWDELEYSVLKRNGEEWIEDKEDWKVEGQSLKLTPSAAEVNYQIKASLYQKSENQDVERAPVSEETIHAFSYNEAVLYAYVPGRSQKDNNIVLRRPDETLIFTVKTQSATLSDDDMSKIVWTVKKDDEIVERNIKGRMILYKFKTPGKYKIIADLSGLKLRNGGVRESVIHNWDEMMILNTDEQTKNALNADSQNGINKEIDSQEGGKVSPIDPAVIRKSEISHTIKISHNEVTKISLASTNGRNYVGVRYPITLSYLFGSADYDELKAIEFTCEGADPDLLRNHKIFKADKPGEYKIIAKLNGKQCEQTISIIDSIFSTWEFCDSKNKKIDTIGKDMKFGIRGCVPAWSVVSGDEKKQNRTIRISLFHKEIALCSFSTELDDNGGFKVEGIDVNKDVIENALKYVPKYDPTSDLPIHFAVYNYPTDIVTGLSNTKNGLGKKSIYCNLKVTSKPYISGYFADKEGNKLVEIINYSDKAKIHLRALNITQEMREKMKVRIYEDVWGSDTLVYENKEKIEIDKDGNVDVEIPIGEGLFQKPENDEKSLPRLFYFKVMLSDSKEFLGIKFDYTKFPLYNGDLQLCVYPESLQDLYEFNVRKEMSQIQDELLKEIVNEKYDSELLHKTRNYFYMLKILSQDKNNVYINSFSSLAPVVVGEDWKKDEKEEKTTNTKCFCHRDFTVAEVKELLKVLRGSEPGNNIWELSPFVDDKSISTFTKELNIAFKKYGINKCIQKMVFLAMACVETQYFKASEEQPSNYASSKNKFKGRGLLHITHQNHYKAYNFRVSKNILDEPELISKEIHNIVDSGATFFSNRSFMHNRVLQNDSKVVKKYQECFSKNYMLTLSQLSLFMESVPEKELDYYLLINRLLNNPSKETPLNWEDRKTAYDKLKQAFKYDRKICKEVELDFPSHNTGWHDPLDVMQICAYQFRGGFGAYNASFHYRGSRPHQGVDLFAKLNTPVYACLDGRIMSASSIGDYGNVIVLAIYEETQVQIFKNRRKKDFKPYFSVEYTDGPGFNKDSDIFYLAYAHLSTFNVIEGDDVKAGDIIGYSGETGNAKGTKGPHVHFEVRSVQSCGKGMNNRCNPALYFDYEQYNPIADIDNEEIKIESDLSLTKYGNKATKVKIKHIDGSESTIDKKDFEVDTNDQYCYKINKK